MKGLSFDLHIQTYTMLFYKFITPFCTLISDFNNTLSWLVEHLFEILSIGISSFIAYHIFFLSKKLTLKDKMRHRDEIKNKVQLKLDDIIHNGHDRKCELVNIKLYPERYTNDIKYTKHGYPYDGGELKGFAFDGVEFFQNTYKTYKTKDNKITLDPKKGEYYENLLVAGVVPYEWIEYVDLSGNEFTNRTLFFVHFKGKDKIPYKYHKYYRVNRGYEAGNQPPSFQWFEVRDIEDE